tara:strand:+ start:32 stop:808 length:777 start_codon:yes stop_codon:yes gene_type:complete
LGCEDGTTNETILRYKYEERLGKLIEIFSYKTVFKYDKNGNKVQISGFTSDGSSSGKIIIKYDSNNNKIEMNNNSLMTKTTYKYDSNNNMIEESALNPNGSLMSKKVYKYNSQNNMIEVSIDSPKDLVESFLGPMRFKYNYDSNNNIVEELQFRSDGSLMITFLYKYDLENNLIEKSGYDENGLLWKKLVYKYDSNNNKIEESFYKSDGNYSTDTDGVSTYKFIYNSENKIQGEMGYFYKTGSGEEKEILKSKTIYQY